MVDRSKRQESATYTSREVVHLTGVTFRQLQWWDERGLVSPMKLGHRRLYTAFEVQQVALIGSLRIKGMSLQKIRSWIEQLSPQQVADALSVNDRDEEVYLLTDGEKVYLEGMENRVMGRIRESELPLTTIYISDLHCGLALLPTSRKPVQSAAERAGKPTAAKGKRANDDWRGAGASGGK